MVCKRCHKPCSTPDTWPTPEYTARLHRCKSCGFSFVSIQVVLQENGTLPAVVLPEPTTVATGKLVGSPEYTTVVEPPSSASAIDANALDARFRQLLAEQENNGPPVQCDDFDGEDE